MKRKLSSGDWVQVRSKEEILRTLDENGRLEGMPFMPEMFQYCEKKFQVYKRAHKSCDYTTPYPFRSRRIRRTVFLNTRCEGSAHGGCQAGCMIFWREEWLKRIGHEVISLSGQAQSAGLNDSRPARGCEESTVWEHTQHIDSKDGSTVYSCQTIELPKASIPLRWWDIRQYFEDYWSGNVSLGRLASGLIYSMYYHLSNAGVGVGPTMRWLYDRFHWVWGGSKFPRTPGLIPNGVSTPRGSLNLQPGELVRVKSHEEILQTVNVDNLNRGMYWDAELVPYCGGTYRVLSRVSKIINEQTGKMTEMKNPCIILDSVICQARYSSCRMFCPRAMYPYWREIWLERVGESSITEVGRETSLGSAK